MKKVLHHFDTNTTFDSKNKGVKKFILSLIYNSNSNAWYARVIRNLLAKEIKEFNKKSIDYSSKMNKSLQGFSIYYEDGLTLSIEKFHSTLSEMNESQKNVFINSVTADTLEDYDTAFKSINIKELGVNYD